MIRNGRHPATLYAVSAREPALSAFPRAEITNYLGAKRWPASSRMH